jgi:hypothetical protein
MSLDEALDQLARAALVTPLSSPPFDTAPPPPDAVNPVVRLQAALDEMVSDARQWCIQSDLLKRRSRAGIATWHSGHAAGLAGARVWGRDHDHRLNAALDELVTASPHGSTP